MSFSRKLVTRVIVEIKKAQIEGEVLHEDDVQAKIKIFSEQDLNGEYELPEGFFSTRICETPDSLRSIAGKFEEPQYDLSNSQFSKLHYSARGFEY
ncbi:MAG: hypothetical protein OXF60_09270 [Gammaproteobacteria bacterium]|nr:hypothetical protein [Gammaproteobacteria bacterium]MCY4218676.1 hypothetical protein [Gammaproteobacteria bacterium]